MVSFSTLTPPANHEVLTYPPNRYLNTLAAAEQLYDALYQWKTLGSLTITTISLPFFRDFCSTVNTGTYASTSKTYNSLTTSIKTYADGYIAIVQKYTPTSGALAEQFSRANGTPLSAVDLTWSYASFLTVAARRAGQVPASWGSSTANTFPSVCSASSATGTYSAPPGTTTTPVIGPCPTGTPATASITFSELETTTLGQNVFIVGSISQLGNWAPANAIALSASQYTASSPRWTVTIGGLAVGTTFQYKYIKKNSDGSVTWESDPNRSFTVPCAGTGTENDTWR